MSDKSIIVAWAVGAILLIFAGVYWLRSLPGTAGLRKGIVLTLALILMSAPLLILIYLNLVRH